MPHKPSKPLDGLNEDGENRPNTALQYLQTLAYASAQLDLATNALEEAHKTLLKIDQKQLSSRQFRGQTAEIRRLAKQIAALGTRKKESKSS